MMLSTRFRNGTGGGFTAAILGMVLVFLVQSNPVVCACGLPGSAAARTGTCPATAGEHGCPMVPDRGDSRPAQTHTCAHCRLSAACGQDTALLAPMPSAERQGGSASVIVPAAASDLSARHGSEALLGPPGVRTAFSTPPRFLLKGALLF